MVPVDDYPPKPGILGLTGFLMGGLSLAVTYLFVHITLGLSSVHDAVGSGLTESVRDGTALTFTLLALFALLPLFVVGLAALMGRHGAHTGQSATAAAALTSLVGVPLVWVNLAIAGLLVGAVHGAQGLDDAFDHVVETLLSSAAALVVALGPLVALAALVANRATSWSAATAGATHTAIDRPATGAAAFPPADLDEEAWETPEPTPESEHAQEAPGPAALNDHPLDCPRCGNTFTVSGNPPLRINCPHCGKSGMIR